jgi:hypothetical protein
MAKEVHMGNSEARLYFAYGSNMDEGQMAIRCPGARLVGGATLDGFRFIINARMVATVFPDPEAHVHGLLWLISPEDERTLDRYEGVEYGTYDKRKPEVIDAEPSRCKPLTYIASNCRPCKVPQGDGYMGRIAQAARSHGLPDDYIEELESWFE